MVNEISGGLEHGFYDFPFSWECHNPKLRSCHIFSEGLVAQPPTRKIWRCRQNEWVDVWIWPKHSEIFWPSSYDENWQGNSRWKTCPLRPSRPFSRRSETTRFKWWSAPTNIWERELRDYKTQLGDGFGNCWHEMFSCSTNRQVASVRFAKGILRFRRNKIKVPRARGCNPEIGAPKSLCTLIPMGTHDQS